jgi:hypothetical protein
MWGLRVGGTVRGFGVTLFLAGLASYLILQSTWSSMPSSFWIVAIWV